MDSSRPTVNQLVLIAGCGTNGKDPEFVCEPQEGYHFFSRGAQVYLWLADEAKRIVNYPATHVQAYQEGGFHRQRGSGEIQTAAAYTVNPQANCRPSFVGPYMDVKDHLEGHPFAMVHNDHAVGQEELSSADKLVATLALSLSILKNGGVLYWDVFALNFQFTGGNWVRSEWNKFMQPQPPVWEKVVVEMNRQAGQNNWKLVWTALRDKNGIDKGWDADVEEGDTRQVTGILIRKV